MMLFQQRVPDPFKTGQHMMLFQQRVPDPFKTGQYTMLFQQRVPDPLKRVSMFCLLDRGVHSSSQQVACIGKHLANGNLRHFIKIRI